MSERLRLPAVICAAVVILALLVGHPYAETGVVDDFSYVYTAKHLAETGHLVYVGWAGAMLGWQVYVAALLFKVFGFSFTVARLTTWATAAGTAFLLQRILARCGASERNAALASLAFALSPVFFMLSSTFMTDVEGLFAIVVCLYCCLRALHASEANARAATAWIITAVASNAVLGTCRQVAWLGTLVIVPSTLWLLRSRRSVVRIGVLAISVAGVFMLMAMYWFQQQPYTMSDSVAAGTELPSRMAFAAHVFRQVVASGLELPLLLLPLTAVFLPFVFRGNRRATIWVLLFAAAYTGLAFHWRHNHPEYLLQPTTGNWLGIYGYIQAQGPRGAGPVLLPLMLRALLTVGSIGGLLGLAVLLRNQLGNPSPTYGSQAHISITQITVVLLPYTIIYAILLIPRGVSQLFDRYLLGLLIFPLVFLVLLYQERISVQLPIGSFALLLLMGIYSVSCVHNSFAQARAEISLDYALQRAGVHEDHVDFGWAYNGWLELQRFGYIDNPAIRKPMNAFVPVPPTVDHACYEPPVLFRYLTLEYGVSYDPSLCSGVALPVTSTYRTWPTGELTRLYVLRYTPLQH